MCALALAGLNFGNALLLRWKLVCLFGQPLKLNLELLQAALVLQLLLQLLGLSEGGRNSLVGLADEAGVVFLVVLDKPEHDFLLFEPHFLLLDLV